MTVEARAARYQQLVKEAAQQLKCRPDSELAQHVGTLRFARETFAPRLISGAETNPADLVRLDDCLRQYLPVQAASRSEPLNLLVARQRRRADQMLQEPPFRELLSGHLPKGKGDGEG